MGVISGKAGTVKVGGTAVLEVTKWTFEPSANISKYASNNTNGHKKAVAGVRDGKGTIETKVDSVLWTAGQSVTLVLHVDGGSTDKITVPAVIATTPINVDIDNGEPISATYTFEADGAWTGAGSLANI